MIFRELCEAYMGLRPADIEDMTLDQIHALACDKKAIKNVGRLVRGTPKDLEHLTLENGSLRGPEGKTLLQLLKEERAAREAADLRRSKKQKRHAARERALAYKRSLEVEGG